MGALLVLLSAALYAGSPILIKIAYAYGAPPLTVLALRYFVATVLIWTGIGVLHVPLNLHRRAVLSLAAIGTTLVPVQVFSFFLALVYLPASTASVLSYVYPLHVAWMSALFLRERVRGDEWLVLVGVVVGAMLVVGETPAVVVGPGVAALFIATLTNAAYYIVARRVLRHVLPITALGVILAGTAIVFAIAGAVTGDLSLAYPVPALLAILGTGILASLLAPLLLLAGLRSLSAARAAMLGTLEPVITVVLSVLLLRDQLTPLRGAGMAMVVGGIALIQVRRPDSDARP